MPAPWPRNLADPTLGIPGPGLAADAPHRALADPTLDSPGGSTSRARHAASPHREVAHERLKGSTLTLELQRLRLASTTVWRLSAAARSTP